jgi:predicted TPR repeat methyltransferase
MPDPLAIALEHHRAGRLRQAAATYQSLLRGNPLHADALHWLGVLATQAGRPAAAVPFLEQAAALRADDPAFAHNLATAHLHAGQYDHAIRAFERALKLVPDRPDTLLAWGLAHLARRQPGDAQAAAFAFRQAMAAGLDTADLYRQLGLALLAADQPAEAADAFMTAAERDPYDPVAYHHLALAHRALGNERDVRRNLNKTLELDPNNARAWHALAQLDLEAGNPDIAANLFRKAAKHDPHYAAPWQSLGRLYQQQGKHAEALDAFKQALRTGRKRLTPSPTTAAASTVAAAPPSPFDLAFGTRGSDSSTSNQQPATSNSSSEDFLPALTLLEQKLTDPRLLERHHALAANVDMFSPTEVPKDAITHLFDKYADTFDAHLVGKLRYTVPERLAEAVAAALAADDARRDDHLLDVLDLGCGTGLIGPLLRPIAATLAGVDLSPAMIDKARARAVYDVLHAGDMIDALRQSPPANFDLLVAADSVIYTGDLTPLFETAHRALRPGGLFAFTVEAGAHDRYHLDRKTLRYTHAPDYLHHLARIHGYDEVTFTPVTARFESDRPVPAYLIVLRTPQSPQRAPAKA